jgi:choline dehydrogenase-like flavoprotein
VKTDADIDAWLRKTLVTAHHPAATCPMGTTPNTVLDPQLRVHGVDCLRVVDASAMPDTVSGHLNAPVLMMAEKGAAMIRGEQPLASADGV